MTLALYRAVFGEDIVPDTKALSDLAESVAVLPQNIFITVVLYYQHQKTIEDIVKETGHPSQLVERWLKSGVKLLQAFYGVGSE